MRNYAEVQGKIAEARQFLERAIAADTEAESLELERKHDDIMNEVERSMNGMDENNAEGTPIYGDQSLDAEMRNYSLVNAVAAQAGMNVDAGRERELSQEMARRSGKDPQGIFAPTSIFEKRVVTSPNSSGGHIIPTEHMDGQFIDLLRANTIVRELGARVMNNLSGNVDIPKHKSSTNVQWVAENSGLSSSDIDFDNVTLSPKHAGALGEYSRNMLQQSSPDIEDLFRRDMAANLGEALDSVALNGGGSNEPTGILATTGVNDVDFSTGEAYKNLQELITTVDEQNTTGTGFAMHPRVRNFFKTVLDADGKPFIMPDRNRLEGLPARVSTLLPTTSGSPDTSKMIFGNWSDLLIGFWSEIDVLVNPYESTAYNKGNVKVRAMMTADVALRHKESFAIGKNIDIS